jgi:hypothetical protein
LPTYYNALRPDPHYRREAFDAGLQALGYTPADPERCDLYLTWNRFGTREAYANRIEARGGRVLVAENATWGNDFIGDRWYSIWPSCHNRAKSIRFGGNERWDDLGIELEPWRAGGGEIVGLMQRGIGPKGTPQGWTPPGCTRIRKHPGTGPCVPLDEDLAKASEVRTWGSGAAVKALMWGIRVKSYMPDWCGEQDNTDSGRLEMFRRLIWAQWRLSEIEKGEPFSWLFKQPA